MSDSGLETADRLLKLAPASYSSRCELIVSGLKTVRSQMDEVRREGARAEALARELEEAQCEVVSYTRQVDRVKEEVQELEQQLELERQGKVDRDGKGNSLFSEVEDRRERRPGTEQKMSVGRQEDRERFSFISRRGVEVLWWEGEGGIRN